MQDAADDSWDTRRGKRNGELRVKVRLQKQAAEAEHKAMLNKIYKLTLDAPQRLVAIWEGASIHTDPSALSLPRLFPHRLTHNKKSSHHLVCPD